MVAVSSPAAVQPRPAAEDERRDGVGLLARLEGICAERGLERLAGRLDELVGFVATDLAAFEEEFGRLPRRPSLVGRSASHLLDLGGKRLRPLCVALAARLGTGFDSRVRDLAVAVELIHHATLLHDDVVDVSDTRRGAPTARCIYGNAASIFAGDWVLIEALRRVHASRLPGLLEELFDTIEAMIAAESLQLECRGRVEVGRDVYFRVVEGKTASVFRWGMVAGGAAGGLDGAARLALADYGRHFGVAFQAVDDLLDLTGDAERTGKALFTDVREGKMTFPLIVALEREPTLASEIEAVVALPDDAPVAADALERVIAALRDTRAVEACLDLARERARLAVAALAAVPDGRARRALATLAEAIVDRDR